MVCVAFILNIFFSIIGFVLSRSILDYSSSSPVASVVLGAAALSLSVVFGGVIGVIGGALMIVGGALGILV